MNPARACVLLVLLAACRAAPVASAYLSVESAPMGSATRLTLLAAPGARINARLAPALERRDGSVLRFDAPRDESRGSTGEGRGLLVESDYYSTPPVLIVNGDARGTIRASVCLDGERVCRMVEVKSRGR